MNKEACRAAFSEELLELAKEDPSIYTIATDSRGSVTTATFFEELPDRAIEMGIAEQNAITVGAGLALTGKNVFVCGPACFLTGRSYEQIKVDVAYNETNVKIVGVSAGMSYGPLGTTHTSLNDIAALRSLPGIDVLVPSDAMQTRWLTQWLATHKGAAYMRMGRGAVENIYPDGENFVYGRARVLIQGKDVAIIACGEMVCNALKAAELLDAEGIDATVIDCFSLRPFDKETVIQEAVKTTRVITVEEHSIFGGLGEQVAHVLSETTPVKMRILGFPDAPYRIGSSSELFAVYGLDCMGIAAAAKALMEV